MNRQPPHNDISGVGDRPTAVRYVVLAGLCAAAAISYVSRNCISVAEQTVRDDLGLSLDEMSWVMSGFFITYAISQIPSGSLADRCGSRRALPLFAAVWSAATVGMALAVGFWSLLITRLVAGTAQAGIFPGSVNTIARWIPSSRRALACGSLASFMSLGGAAAVALTGLLLEGGELAGLRVPALNWRWIFGLFSLPGFVWAIWFFSWFRDGPQHHLSVNQAEIDFIRSRHDTPSRDTDSNGVGRLDGTPWVAILSSCDMWLICGQQFFRAAGYIFYATWFPTFLQESRGVSTAQSGYLTSLPLLAVVVGSLVGGVVVDWVFHRTGSLRMSRQMIGVFSMLSCGICIFAAYFVQDAHSAVIIIAAGSFCAALAGPCAYALTIDKGGSHVATVFSTMNMSGNIGAAICPVIVARVVTVTANWNSILFFFAAIYVVAGACWALINPDGSVCGDN